MLSYHLVIGILMSFFTTTTFHQVMVVTAHSDKELNSAVNSIIKTMNHYGSCEDSPLKKLLKNCLQNADKQLNSDEDDLEFQCKVKFKRDLCIIDAACKWCNGKAAEQFEDSIKEEWTNEKDDQHRVCACWYDDYEYAYKRRCDSTKRLIIIIGVTIIGLLLFLGSCIGCIIEPRYPLIYYPLI